VSTQGKKRSRQKIARKNLKLEKIMKGQKRTFCKRGKGGNVRVEKKKALGRLKMVFVGKGDKKGVVNNNT